MLLFPRGRVVGVRTRTLRQDRINIRLKKELKEEFEAACTVRGLKMSAAIHQFIVRTVREEKEKSLDEFLLALQEVRATETTEATEELPAEKDETPSTSPQKKRMMPVFEMAVSEPKTSKKAANNKT